MTEKQQVTAVAKWIRDHAEELAIDALQDLRQTCDGYEPPTTGRRWIHEMAADICNDLRADQHDETAELQAEWASKLGVQTRRVMT